MRRCRFALAPLALLGFLLFSAGLLAEDAPSNGEVGKEVDDITAGPEYRWLRKGGATPPKKDSPSTPAGSGNAGKGRGKKFEKEDSGCGYEPDFADIPVAEESDNCGNPTPGGCSCAPDLGGCDMGLPQGCGGVAGPGVDVSGVGWVLAAVVLLVFIFLVVKTLLQSRSPMMPLAELPLDPDEVRISHVQSIGAASLMDRARQAATGGDFKGAVGFAYLAGISLLARGGYVELDNSTTNWTIVRSTRSRGGPYEPAGVLIRQFEELFFGERLPSAERWEICRRIVEDDFAPLGEEGTR